MKLYTFTWRGQRIESRVPRVTFDARMNSASRGGRQWTVAEAATTPRIGASAAGRMAAAKLGCRATISRAGESAWTD